MSRNNDESGDEPYAGDPAEAPQRRERLQAAVAAEIVRASAAEPAPGLYLVPTPIGNLADMSLRALVLLAAADVIYCEDTRHSRILMAHYGIGTRLEAYHEHNAEAQRPRVMQRLGRGQVIALISDAGTPLVSDPGFKLVRACIAAGFHVEGLPGACAAIVALTGAGLPTDAFHFAGFLPAKSAARQRRIGELKPVPSTLLFYEAPQRLTETLGDLASVLGPRPAAIARELTKRHAEFIRGSLAELAAKTGKQDLRGEIVIVVGPPGEAEADDDTIRERLEHALQSLSLRDAAKAVAETLRVPKQRVYELGLAMKGKRET